MTTPAPNDEADWDAHYTSGFRARCRLGTVRPHVPDSTDEPDPDICSADDHLDEWVKLVREFHHIRDAARIVENRYQQDRDHGGALTAIAKQVRNASWSALAGLWESVCDKYIATTLEKDRRPWDCPFCDVNVPPEETFDTDRCPECMCILRERDDGQGWM